MAYIEISNLPETFNLDNNSVFPVVYQGETKKVKFSSLTEILNYFTSVSYNKTTGVYTFTRVNGSTALLSKDLQLSIKDVSILNGVMTITQQSGVTSNIDITVADGSITYANLAVALQTRIDMKYSKPGSGIPKSDLASDIQTSLGKVDTAIQEQDLNDYQPKIERTHKLDADLVDDTNSTNKFITSAEKTQIETNTADISNIKDGTSIDSFGDLETVLSAKQTQMDNLQAEKEALYNDHPDITSKEQM